MSLGKIHRKKKRERNEENHPESEAGEQHKPSFCIKLYYEYF